eukprot:589295-Amphidinium_carterae.2
MCARQGGKDSTSLQRDRECTHETQVYAQRHSMHGFKHLPDPPLVFSSGMRSGIPEGPVKVNIWLSRAQQRIAYRRACPLRKRLDDPAEIENAHMSMSGTFGYKSVWPTRQSK